MNKYTAKFAKLSAGQSKALSESMNAAYLNEANSKRKGIAKKSPAKKK